MLKEPITEEYYDGIIVVVDRFSKLGRFIPFRETITAPNLAYLFLKKIVAYYGVLEVIVLDRDKLFILNF